MRTRLRILWLCFGLMGLLVACSEPLIRSPEDTAAPPAQNPLAAALQRLAVQLPPAGSGGKTKLLLEPVALGLTGEVLTAQDSFSGPLRTALRTYSVQTYQPENTETTELVLSVFVIPASSAPDTEVELYGLLYEPQEGQIKAQARVALAATQVPLATLRAGQGPIYPDTISLGELWRSVERNQRLPNYYLRGLRLRAQLYLAQRHFERKELTQAEEIWGTLRDNIDLLVKDRVLARQTKLAATLGLYQIALEQQKLAQAEKYLLEVFKLLAEGHQPILARFPFKTDSAEWLEDPQSQTRRQLLAQAARQLLAMDKNGRLTLISHVSKPGQGTDASALSQARARVISDLISAPNKRLKGRIQAAWKGSNESLSLSRNPAINAVDNRAEFIWLKLK